MFEQYSQIIRQRYPELNIIGENYNPSPWKVTVAQFLSSFKLVLIGLILFGVNPFTYLNMPTPNFFVWATENKVRFFFKSDIISFQCYSNFEFKKDVCLYDVVFYFKCH